MRELKFRIFDDVSRKFQYFNLMDLCAETKESRNIRTLILLRKEVQQWTGKTDETNKDVYEGDTIESYSGMSGVVWYSNERAEYVVCSGEENSYYDELGSVGAERVLGRNYDTSELLGGIN
jgi:hypothetical protein